MTAPEPSQPLTAPDFTRARNLWARAEEQRDDENAPYLDTIESLSYHVPDLLVEVDSLRAKLAELPDLDTIRRIEKERGSWGMQLSEARRERDALAAKLEAIRTVKHGPVGDEAAYVTGWNDCRAEVHRALDQSGEGQANG